MASSVVCLSDSDLNPLNSSARALRVKITNLPPRDVCMPFSSFMHIGMTCVY
jgi:hypothetical protein